ncbi:MAG: proprotein convertase P-domain-containing protein [Oligoflexia bacterium]|nr:proprotein convertase P-domain-containing protein [Oligoflexia bacterium]
MRKILIWFCVTVSMLITATAFAEWVSVGPQYKGAGGNEPNYFSKHINSKYSSSLDIFIQSLDIKKSQLSKSASFNKSKYRKSKFIELAMTTKGDEYLAKVGYPRLPVIRKWIAYSGKKSELTVTVKKGVSNLIPLKEYDADALFPVQASVVKIPGAYAKAAFSIDEKFYASDEFYPKKDYEILDTISIRGKKLVLVEYYPLKYNPYRKELLVENEVSISLDVKKFTSKVEKSPSFNHLINSMSFNESTYSQATSSTFAPEKLLMIVGSKYVNLPLLKQYIAVKNAIGYEVSVVDVLEIGNSDVAIRNYIKSQEQLPTYLLIIGDVADVATHQGVAGSNNQATDHFYACVDQVSYESDIGGTDLFVSRIPVNNEGELNTILQKMIRYQEMNFSDSSWIKRVSWVATDDRYQVAEASHNYVIDNYTAGLAYLGNFPSAASAGGDKLYAITHHAATADLSRMFNEGRAIINYSGHGAHTYWAGPSFMPENVRAVNHPDARPFVISNACITNSFAMEGDCFGETWLKHAAGALSFWGASNNSLWDEDDILERAMYDSLYRDHRYSIGEITTTALNKVWLSYAGAENAPYYMEIYNVTGDSSIKLLTETPKKLEVKAPEVIMLGLDDYTLSTHASALVVASVFTKKGVKKFYSDQQGLIRLRLSSEELVVGEKLQIALYAHSYLPKSLQIPVVVNDIAYVGYAGHEVLDGENGKLNPGEKIELNLQLKNVGSKPTEAFNAVLFSENPKVKVLAGEVSFENLAPEEVGVSLQKATIEVEAGSANATVVPLSLRWSLVGGSSGTSSFEEKIEAPEVKLLSAELVETRGNGNGRLDANEEGALILKLKNSGNYSIKKELSQVRIVNNPGGAIQIPTTTLALDSDLDVGASQEVKFNLSVGAVADGIKVTFLTNVAILGDISQSYNFASALMIGGPVQLNLTATALPKTIPDNDEKGIVSSIEVPRSMILTKVSVHVKVEHTYIGDLAIMLKSPQGKEITLHNRSGSSDNNIDCWYGEGCRSAAPLEALIGENAKGRFELFVKDAAATDVGTLQQFELKLEGYLRE